MVKKEGFAIKFRWSTLFSIQFSLHFQSLPSLSPVKSIFHIILYIIWINPMHKSKSQVLFEINKISDTLSIFFFINTRLFAGSYSHHKHPKERVHKDAYDVSSSTIWRSSALPRPLLHWRSPGHPLIFWDGQTRSAHRIQDTRTSWIYTIA